MGGTSTGHKIYNTVFFGNILGVRLQGIPDDIDFQNCIWRSNTTDYETVATADGSPTNITFDYNNEATDTGLKGTNGVVGTPGLIDEMNPPNLRLDVGSILENVGATLSASIPAFDAWWAARPQGASWDIGAHEFYSASNAPVNTAPASQNILPDTAAAIAVSVTDADNNITSIVLNCDEGSVSVTLSPGVTAS
jgi:hypothetical protein